MSDTFTFDTDRSEHLFYADAYEGGAAWECPSLSSLGTATLWRREVIDSDAGQRIEERAVGQVRSYLSPWPAETLGAYTRRRRLAVYVNICEPIVDAYADTVTADVARDLGPLEPFLRTLDGQSQPWSELVGDVARQLALDGVTAVVLDAPPENPASTRADEVARGIGLRATVVPRASWAWLTLDDYGGVVEFAYADAPSVDVAQVTRRVRVWCWTRAGWSVRDYQLPQTEALDEHVERIRATPPTRSGPLPGGATEIPVVFAYHQRLRTTRAPRGKSIAATPSRVSLQIYQLLSAIEDTHRRAPPFLAVPTRATNGLSPSVRAQVGPESGLPVPEGASVPEWVTFPPESLKDIREHVAFLVALAYRVSGLEVQADQSAQVQSGEALRVRSRDFEKRARKLAAGLKTFEDAALALAARILRFTFTATVTYPQRFVLGDTAELAEAALMVLEKLGKYLGEEGVKAAIRQAIASALTLDDAGVARVLAEVEAKLRAPVPPPSPPSPPSPSAPPVDDQETSDDDQESAA